jgi:hypothetical protein
MNTKPTSQKSPSEQHGAIRLVIRGLTHVPSFKNSKQLIGGHPPRLITKPERKQWMDRCEASFVSQFISLYQTTESVMPMVRSRRSWIACVAPLNDSVKNIPELHVYVKRVKKSDEGAVILIEPLW